MLTDTKGLSRNAIKCIAMITMLIDHIAVIFITQDTLTYTIMHQIIGRIAFPLFAYLIVDGFDRSKNHKQKIYDYIILALITEIFFDKALKGEVPCWTHQNIMWTWVVCVIALVFIQKLYNTEDKKIFNVDIMLRVIIILGIACLACSYGRTDYSFVGPLCVILSYILKEKKPDISPIWLIVLISIIVVIFFEIPGYLLAIPIIILYNPDKPSTYNKTIKYGFYGFYPIHLAILAGICIYFRI